MLNQGREHILLKIDAQPRDRDNMNDMIRYDPGDVCLIRDTVSRGITA